LVAGDWGLGISLFFPGDELRCGEDSGAHFAFHFREKPMALSLMSLSGKEIQP